ncbi:cobalamin B12-binding domain-containing protein [Kitasatospora sp. NPDC096147]|uniref:cobalamin B12-binding domain-containing protein n=1 Tax=Kitasatospora sp. NPDC096147 TaxID=3364093 RepID=UPI0037FA30A5
MELKHRPAQPRTRTPRAAHTGLDVLVTSVASDAHTWNLIYLQLLLEESGHRVTNLGACVPDQLLVDECLARRPDLVVVSTVNGHGLNDGRRVIEQLRSHPELRDTQVVIGGKLGIAGSEQGDQIAELTKAGFNAVFPDGAAITGFNDFVQAIPARSARRALPLAGAR